MSQRVADMRDVALLTAAAVFGAFLLAALPIVGVPLEAAALATLAYRFRESTAWLAALVAVATVALISWPTALVLVAPMIVAAGPLSARALRFRPALAVAVFIGVAVFFATLASLLLDAAQAGKPLLAYIDGEMATALQGLVAGAPKSSSTAGLDPVALRSQMIMLLPGWFVLMSALTGVLGTLAIAWAGLKAGVTTRRFPKLTELQISTYALVPIIAGLLALAVARVTAGSTASVLSMIGGNLLVIGVPLLTLQGLGIVLFWLTKLHVPRWGRVAATLGAFVVEPIMPVLTLVGLMDTWFDFRRLRKSETEDRNERD